MAKMSKKARKKKTESRQPPTPEITRPSFLERLEEPRVILFFFIALFIFLMFFYKPLVFDGYESAGSDVISGIGKLHQVREFQEKTGKRVLWNPFMFAGMPIYHRFGPVVWSIDVVLNKLDVLIDWRVWYMWAGALGIFLLVKFLGLSALVGMMAGVGFILMPHFQALIVVGHFAKLRALMWMPYVLLTFLFLLKYRNLLGLFLFASAMAIQLRTQHYQIIFYTLLLLLFVGIVPYFRLLVEKKYGDFLRFNGLFVASLILVIIMVAQPLFVIRDYTPYSTRGGNAVSIKEKTDDARQKKGVGFDYATNWSYSVSEWWNLIIPKFHGGTSQEVYEGDSVPQLKGQVIPSYWGSMPFTQSYEYMGIILIFFALTGIFFQWQRAEVKSLTFLTILALLLSLGKNFASLYKLFFYYVPYFDKFRVPMMILTLVMFNTTLLAAFGLNHLLKHALGKEEEKLFYLMAGLVAVLLLIPYLFGSGFSLSQPQEVQRFAAQYGEDQAKQIVRMLRMARLDILKASTLRTLLFFVLTVGLIFSWRKNWLKKDLFAAGVVVLVALDLGLISGNYLKGKFADPEQMETRTYRRIALDDIIQQDQSLFRVAPPLRQIANDTRWSYYYQSIGGYAADKLQVIQDIFDNNLYESADPRIPFNLPVLSMLNGKYLVESNRWNHPDLQLLGSDPNQNLFLYLNRAVLPRAFFVDSIKVIPDGVERLKYMNSEHFHPERQALLEKTPPATVQPPDSSFARYLHFEPDKIVIEAYTDRPALLVVSEIYYPKGWHAYLENGEELEIFKTNHLLRSVVVPEGKHTITMEFHPAAFFTGVKISLVGWLITYAGILILLFKNPRTRKSILELPALLSGKK